MTTLYSAAIDTSDIELSFCEEVTWGTSPTTTYTPIRLTGESLSESKQRARPQEINPSGVVSHAITTQVGVEGALNFALSNLTFDKFLAAALNGAWATGHLENDVPPTITTFTIQKKLASALWLRYAGCYLTGFSINASVGGFVEGSFTVMAKSEAKATATLGTVATGTTGRVIDTVSGVGSIEFNDVAFSVPIQSIQLNVTKDGARQQFAIGSADAKGIGRGTLNVTGSIVMYFANFDQYDLYKSEADTKIEFSLTDSGADGYKFTLPAATLMNPTIVAGGPDSDVMAEFQLEGNPDSNGVILMIDTVTG